MIPPAYNPFRPRRLALYRSHRKCLTRAAFAALASALGLPLTAPSVRAANYYWDGGTANIAANGDGVSQGGAGTWSTAIANWDVTNASPHSVWVTGNTAIFGGTAGTVNLGTAISAAGATFNVGGYTVATGANTLTLTGPITTSGAGGTTTFTGTVASGAAQTWTIATGDTLQYNATFSGAVTANALQINSNGTTNITNTFSVVGKSTLAGSGIYNLSGTESFGTAADNYNGIQGATVNKTAGTTSFTGAIGNGFFIGNTGSAAQGSVLNVTGGAFSVGNTRIFIGDGFSGVVTTAGDGTVSVGGGAGTATFNTGTGTLTAALGNNVATGTININTNGTVSSNRAWTSGTAGKGVINFNGGTLQALGTNLGITTGITTNIADGGGIIDANGFAVSLATNFTHGGTAATDGGLRIASSVTGTPGTVALTGTLSHTGGLTFTTGGSLSGNNSYTGPTVINAAVDGSVNGTFLGATGAGNGTTINTGGTLRFRDSSNRTIAEAFTLNGGAFINFNNPGTTTYTGAFTLNTSSVLQVNPASQTSTTVTHSAGFLEGGTASSLTFVRNSTAAATTSADTVSLTGASTYGGNTFVTDINSTYTGLFALKLSGGDNRLPTTTVVTLGGVSNGFGVAAGNGRLILGDVATGAINQTVAGLTTSGSGTNNSVVGAAGTVSTLTVNNTTNYTFSGLVGGTGTNNNNLALTKSGAGALTLTAANTYTGATLVSGGVLYAQSTLNVPLSTSAVTVSPGANVAIGDHAGGVPNYTNNFTLNGAGTSVSGVQGSGVAGAGAFSFFNSGNFSLTGTVNLATTALIYNNPATQTTPITFSGVISGAGGLVLAGASSGSGAPNYVLSNANTYGTTTATTLLTNAGTPATTVTLNTADNVLPANTVLTFGGTPTGQAGSYNGAVNLALGGVSQTVAGLGTGGSGTYRIVGSSATLSTLTVNNAAANTFSGILGNTGTNNNNLALVKNGAGSLILSGASSFTGGTTISGGTLIAANATALGTGIVSIGAGTLGSQAGTLSIANAVSTAGTTSGVAPGASATSNVGTIGALTLTNGLNLTNGATIFFDLGATPAGSDRINVTGGTFTGAADTGSGSITFAFNNLGVPDASTTYALINYTGAIASGVDLGDFAATGVEGAFQFNGSQLEFVTAVPEPATVLGGVCVTAILGWHLFSRRRRAA